MLFSGGNFTEVSVRSDVRSDVRKERQTLHTYGIRFLTQDAEDITCSHITIVWSCDFVLWVEVRDISL